MVKEDNATEQFRAGFYFQSFPSHVTHLEKLLALAETVYVVE